MGGTVSEQRWERRLERRVALQALDRTAEFIAALREQVQAERQAHAETRRLLTLQGRVEELEAKLALVEKKTSSGATPSTVSSPEGCSNIPQAGAP